MKPFSVVIYVVSLLLVFSNSDAADPGGEEDILAQRGKGTVTQQAFAARADSIPANVRLAALQDRNRLRDVINTLLLRSQLAQDAREAGFDKEDIVKERMRLAADAELAKAWVSRYTELQPAADYEAMAREYYQLNQSKILSSDKIDVSHILVSTEDRSDDEAMELADSISRQLTENPAAFDEFVLKYSEDSSVAANKGRFYNIKKGDMQKPFERVAFTLSEGEISGPVKTRYGYHIIRLDRHPERRQLKFDEVEARLISQARSTHEERIKNDYLSSLTSLDVSMTEAALDELTKRLFGENTKEAPPDSSE